MNSDRKLQRHLSPLGAWAFAIGTSVGWGSLVVTSSTYLKQAGPMGSTLGLIIGALIMLLIGWNYAYLMKCYPEAGGAFVYSREAFGHDQGFLTAWFMAMTYFAILWANMTSLPLFARIFLGNIFRFGRLYTLFGYDVYLGEVLLSIAALVLIALLCMKWEKVMDKLMIVLALMFCAGIGVCFVGAVFGGGSGMLSPAYVPDSAALSQIIKIAVISPWAFIGFESISHGTEEFGFEHSKIRRVMLISVLSTLALYILVTLLSVTAYPARYASWLEYIRDLDSLDGLEALPAFYAASRYLGGFGVTALMLSLLALVITSLIGNMTALSRLFYSMARDSILPKRFAILNRDGVPSGSLMLVMLISILIPFVGRTAIGWIVDVTTIGATLIYGFVSASACRVAKNVGDKREMWLGRVGMGLMVAFGAYILLPNLLSKSTLATETYFLFVAWSVLGFLFFRYILQHDSQKRFGNSITVWVVLLALVLFVALIWMRQSMITSNEKMLTNIQAYYDRLEKAGTGRFEDAHYIEEQVNQLQVEDARTILMAIGMFAFALVIMFTNHSYMTKRSRESEQLAVTDPMTGVKNKHAYLLKERQLNEFLADGRAEPFAIVVCDVNGLKMINDTQGHKAGDEYIRAACAMVCEIFAHSPVYRVGGDEFVAVLSGRDYTIRRELMTALHDTSVEHIASGGAVVSGGLAELQDGDSSAHDVFQRADEGMYEEKKLLKSLGAVTREDAEERASELPPELQRNSEIVKVRRHILIAEDEFINQQILGKSLEDGYEVLYASDGAEAMIAIREHKDELALVMLDLQMPRMTGLAVLKSLQEDPELDKIPVIVLTADQEAEVECLKLGAMDFIPKPYPKWEIIQTRVNKCIELSENRDIIQSTERDSLTKLFNIDYFLRYVKLFDQHYADRSMDAVVVDINHFHMINERYGKHYGDSVLRRIGDRIRSLARQIGGVSGRRGGDTFLIYCPHRTDYDQLLEKISAGLSEDDISSNRVRLRMGVYSEVDKTLDIERRFDRAKLASDTVKSSYVKSVGIYDTEMHNQAIFREKLLEDFHASLEQNRFTVFYQPKFDIRPDTPVLSSAEALARWNHPELGMISPGVFIPVLEENGLIMELDRFVWRETAAQIRAWKERFGYAVPVSVNVSRIDMLTPNLKDVFQEILDAYGLDTKDLVLEITESAYTGDSEQVISTARELRGMGMGFRIEMDDFGTGYSSLGMLSHLPIDALKLDMSFVRSAFGETRDVRMIELIIDIADYLNVPVVAEGVETEEQLMILKAMGCDLVQGYYFSRPVPPEEFNRFLVERGRAAAVITPEIKQTCMSISAALTGDFESIFYVDLVTSFYLEFGFDPDGALQIRPGGTDFFSAPRDALIEGAAPQDREKLADALRRDSLQSWLTQDESPFLAYSRQIGGAQKPCLLQTIRTRASDDHHIVIGIRPQ
ncbi:MAG: amino acid permease [Clostridia bacterium]|nr:amino acid permease [Clostridia bacterium]